MSPSGTKNGFIISSVKSVSRNFYHIPTAFGYVPVVHILANLTGNFQTILVLLLEGYKSSATPLTTPTSLEIFGQTPLRRLNLSSHINIMSVFYYEPYYDFDRLLDDIFTPRTARHHFNGDQNVHRRALQSDATPEGAVRALKPRFVIKVIYPLYKYFALTPTYLQDGST